MSSPQFRYNPLTNKLDLSDTAGGGGSGIKTITGDTGGAVGETAGNINVVGSGGTTVTGNPGTSTLTITSTDLHVARFIVSAGGATDGANYTTIASAIAAAVSAGGQQTVFIQDGVYTENLTLPNEINLTAFGCDGQYGQSVAVIIKGKCSATFSGEASYSGISFETNGDYCIEITGSNPTNLIFTDCQFLPVDHDAIHASSSGSDGISFFNCTGNIYGDFRFFVAAQLAGLNIYGGVWAKASGSPTADTITDSVLQLYSCLYNQPIITTGSSSSVTVFNSRMNIPNVTPLTLAGNANLIFNTSIESGTASAISISGNAKVSECQINSSNTNAITGAGTLQYGHLTFTGISSGVNTTTVIALPVLPVSATGDVVGPGSAVDNDIAVFDSTTGKLIKDGGKTIAQIAPLTTKGDVYTFSTVPNRLAVGTDGYVLTANSGATNGVDWQPAGGSATGFTAYASADLSNVTGNSVIYDVIFNSTSRNDGTCYNTATGVFTAPSTGMYTFNTILFLVSGTSFTAGSEILVSSLGSVQSQIIQLLGAAASAQANAAIIVAGSWSVQMTAGDTMKVQTYSNSTLQDVTIKGAVISPNTFTSMSTFSGFKVN